MKNIILSLSALFAGARVSQGYKIKQGGKWGYGKLLTNPGYYYVLVTEKKE